MCVRRTSKHRQTPEYETISCYVMILAAVTTSDQFLKILLFFCISNLNIKRKQSSPRPGCGSTSICPRPAASACGVCPRPDVQPQLSKCQNCSFLHDFPSKVRVLWCQVTACLDAAVMLDYLSRMSAFKILGPGC